MATGGRGSVPGGVRSAPRRASGWLGQSMLPRRAPPPGDPRPLRSLLLRAASPPERPASPLQRPGPGPAPARATFLGQGLALRQAGGGGCCGGAAGWAWSAWGLDLGPGAAGTCRLWAGRPEVVAWQVGRPRAVGRRPQVRPPLTRPGSRVPGPASSRRCRHVVPALPLGADAVPAGAGA